MKLRRISLVLFLLGLGLVYPAPDAFACSCAEPPRSDKVAVRDSDAVFSGVTEGSSGPAFSDEIDAFSFQVDQVYKGQVFAEQWIRVPGTDPNSCGYHFHSGKRYLVFGYLDDKRGLSTNSCSSTRPLAPDEEPDLQAAGTLIPSRSRATPPNLFLALLTVAVGFGAYRLGKKHRPL